MLGLRFQIFTNLCPQSQRPIQSLRRDFGPFIVDFGKFFDAHGVNFRRVFDFLARQAFGAEILRIIDNKRLFVVRL